MCRARRHGQMLLLHLYLPRSAIGSAEKTVGQGAATGISRLDG
jgi:hypothetical protein